MAVSSTANVARWSALVLGITYGFWHQSSLVKSEQAKATIENYHHKEELIRKAKAAYAAQQAAKNPTKDPNDPAFDLEKLIIYYGTQEEL
ncbi:1265_t:CDS:2 [Acaulospora morrowiae]|uniref:ATP synthase F(0) complex subunit e, mitochondrial n=1 Tax=Acaulospora morrowiae TaxID=94023 RepID=A0A9N9GKN6_9GLOM|nr:1265_t:CDS:2 [Acaulospora morrowiae]